MDIIVGPEGTLEFSEFNPAEAYHVAVRLEERGLAFYERLQSQLLDPLLESVVGQLVLAEKSHLAFFEARLRLERDMEGPSADLSGLLALPVFAEEVDVEALFEGDFEPARAVRAAMAFEEDSIRFYEALLAETNKPGNRRAIEDVIREEKKHLASLAELL